MTTQERTAFIWNLKSGQKERYARRNDCYLDTCACVHMQGCSRMSGLFLFIMSQRSRLRMVRSFQILSPRFFFFFFFFFFFKKKPLWKDHIWGLRAALSLRGFGKAVLVRPVSVLLACFVKKILEKKKKKKKSPSSVFILLVMLIVQQHGQLWLVLVIVFVSRRHERFTFKGVVFSVEF